MKRALLVVAMSLVFTVGTRSAHGLGCSANGTNYTCDWICGESFPGLNPCGNPTTLADCDDPPNGNDDGICTICGQTAGGNNLINGTPDGDVICGKGGNDTINGQGGNDIIEGDADNDTITGGLGDDIIDGGSGDDIISDTGGSNILHGGTGADMITQFAGLHDSVFGTSLCGDGGKDVLEGRDYGHQCMDAGTQQGTTGGVDCTYVSPAPPLDIHDAASAINCRQSSPSLPVRSCACD